MNHSKIVGGSTAKRVINCPGSVALCAAMPPKPSSSFADEGTLLHEVMSEILTDIDLDGMVDVKTYEGITLTQELVDEKIKPALALLDEVDPGKEMTYAVESRVGFGDLLPGVFGSTDYLGRMGDKAVVLDWKFGNGVIVEAEENEQLMFYAAAAMRTPDTQWVFDGVKEIELVIVQPPMIKRWTTTPERIKIFESTLVGAVKAASKPNAKLLQGEHCRWCAAKPTCPKMTGAVDRALAISIKAIDAPLLGRYLANADLLEQWITDLRGLAFQMLEQGAVVPGYKLVAKRATRKWLDEQQAERALRSMGLTESDVKVTSLISPAQAEKVLKKTKQVLPGSCVVAISSGSTMAAEGDPRPAIVQIGQTILSALQKL